MRWLVQRSAGCLWLKGSTRTTVRAFRHRLVTRGGPVRTPLHRLSRSDTEWVEKAIQEDVARGQLVKGESTWGSPAFPTKETADHKPIKRGRRLVVDYRGLNRVTERRFFIIPNSDGIKSSVAGSKFISVGDLKEGFNQCQNEPESSQKMAVLAPSGTYLPSGLTFGPTNGPEDFQELVFIIFGRRLYQGWFVFIDDLAVGTGRPRCTPMKGPSGAEDVVTRICEEYCMRVKKFDPTTGADSNEPFAHVGYFVVFAFPGGTCSSLVGSGILLFVQHDFSYCVDKRKVAGGGIIEMLGHLDPAQDQEGWAQSGLREIESSRTCDRFSGFPLISVHPLAAAFWEWMGGIAQQWPSTSVKCM